MGPAPLSFLLQVTNSTGGTPAGGGSIWSSLLELAIILGAIVVVGSFATRLVRSIVRRAGASRSVVTSVTEWMGVIMILAAAASVTTVAGLSSYLTALTLSGIAGLAISLALQNTISNVISGVLMQHDGVIHLGDDVQYGNGGVRGEVVKLSLRSTWLKTKDGVVVVIGNTNLSGGPILNYTSLERVQKKLLE